MKIKNYIQELAARSKRSRVYKDYQLHGLEVAALLKDEGHKSLYMKLFRNGDTFRLRSLAADIAGNEKIRNKGAYFMAVIAQSGKSSPAASRPARPVAAAKRPRRRNK